MTPKEITELRVKLGLTQTELASKLGIGIDTVRSWERVSGTGMRRPSGPALVLLKMLAEGKI